MVLSRKIDFYILMGWYFCDALMEHEYRLYVGYIHAVVFWLGIAYALIVRLQI